MNDATEPPQTTVALWSRTREEPAATWRLDGRGTGARLRRERASARRVDRGRPRRRLGHPLTPEAGRVFEPRSAAFGGSEPGRHARGYGRRRRRRPHLDRPRRPGAEAPRPVKHALAVVAASFSADGSRLLTASNDQTARIWDVRTGRELVALRATDPSWRAPCSTRTSVGGDRRTDDRTARVWDALTGQELERLPPSIRPTSSLRLRPETVASCSPGGRLPRARVPLRDVRPAGRPRSPRPQPSGP